MNGDSLNCQTKDPNSYFNKHANPEDIISVKEVRDNLQLLRYLAFLLLRHPPILDDN